MIQNRVDHFLVAMDDLENPLGHSGFEEQLCNAIGYAGIALRWLEDEGIADAGGDRAHPERDHRREVERRDTRTNAQWLAHRIDVDARTRALRIFALQHMRQAAAEFDNLQPALDIALAVGNHLAMLGREQVRQLVHMLFDQRLEIKHHPRPALRVHRGPCRLCRLRSRNRLVQHCLVAQSHSPLHAAIIRVHDIAEPRCRRRTAHQEMIYLTHVVSLLIRLVAAALVQLPLAPKR